MKFQFPSKAASLTLYTHLEPFRHTVINSEIVKTQITMTLFEVLNRLYGGVHPIMA